MSVIWWARRDLRLTDNVALGVALKTGMPVIPLFIIDSELIKRNATAVKRVAFLLLAWPIWMPIFAPEESVDGP